MTPTKVLIIDDEPDIVKIITESIEDPSRDITTAYSAPEAMEILAQKEIDLVLSDISMPGMSGLDMYSALVSKGFIKPVIFVTAFASKKVAIEALKLGAFDIIEKPFDIDHLLQVVETAEKFSRDQEIAIQKLKDLGQDLPEEFVSSVSRMMANQAKKSA